MKRVNKLYILEGADGTGKSTLANEILSQTKGHLLHASYEKGMDVVSYHIMLHKVALELLEYQDVVLDRWAVSEEVYGKAFRGKSQYNDVDEFMTTELGRKFLGPRDTVFVYCSNDSAIENHESNKKIREEMFDTMEPVVAEYERYMQKTKLPWLRYDFTKVNMKEFVKGIVE